MTTLYAREDLTQVLWDELQPLLKAHYLEVAHFKDVPLEPSHEGYLRIQNNDALRIFTARTDDKLVGYMVVFVSISLHYASKVYANQDIFYVEKSLRGMRIGAELDLYARNYLRDYCSVDILFQHSKHADGLNIGPFLKRQGYEHIDDIWAIRLDKE